VQLNELSPASLRLRAHRISAQHADAYGRTREENPPPLSRSPEEASHHPAAPGSGHWPVLLTCLVDQGTAEAVHVVLVLSISLKPCLGSLTLGCHCFFYWILPFALRYGGFLARTDTPVCLFFSRVVSRAKVLGLEGGLLLLSCSAPRDAHCLDMSGSHLFCNNFSGCKRKGEESLSDDSFLICSCGHAFCGDCSELICNSARCLVCSQPLRFLVSHKVRTAR
jgi:hypothetical protein